MTNKQIITAFLRHQYGHNKSLRTDGTLLHFNNNLIGTTSPHKNVKFIHNIPNDPNPTTQKIIKLARHLGAQIINI